MRINGMLYVTREGSERFLMALDEKLFGPIQAAQEQQKKVGFSR